MRLPNQVSTSVFHCPGWLHHSADVISNGAGGISSVFGIVGALGLVCCETSMALHKKFADMSWDEVREALFTDYDTGIPNKRAYNDSVKSGTQMHVECTSLHDNIDLFRRSRREMVLPALAKALHEEDPENVYYVDGARFKVQADDLNQALTVVQRINRRLANCTFTFEAGDGEHVECRGLGFSYGVGINEDDAVDAFRGRVTVTRQRRYIHRFPDCIAQIEGLHKFRYPLIAFHIPLKLRKR
jgi:hypothetical protein